MKKVIIVGALLSMLGLVACSSGCSTVPNANQVTAIQIACNQDKIVRPIVIGLVAARGNPADSILLKESEGVIDQVCANPSATPDANLQAAFNKAMGDVAALEGALLAKQAADQK